MEELIPYFKYLNGFNWGTGPYQWFFYAGILLVLILERNKTARIIFGWLPLAFLVAIFNPIFNRAIRIVFPNPDAYYVRMFSFVPVTYGIGVGLMEILTKMRGWIKALVLLGFTILIIMTGTDVYHALDMKPAANPEKVPAELSEIIQAVREDERKLICVAVPSPLATSIRQIDANLITPYGRDDDLTDSLYRNLSQIVPDVQSAMIEAGKRSVDYIIVRRNSECEEAFRQCGYEAWNKTKNHLIYLVENVPMIKREYDKEHHVLSEIYLDENGNFQKTEQGYVKIVYQYDMWGYRSKETYLDENGEPFTLSSGYCSKKRTYQFPSGLMESMSCLDKDDKMALVGGRYETRYTYDGKKRMIQESYYDDNGQLMNRTDMDYAIRKIEYDEKGWAVRERYYGADEQPIIQHFGYAAVTFEYNEKHQIIREEYWDKSNKPILLEAGYSGFFQEVDEFGNVLRRFYLDNERQITERTDGFAILERTYNEQQQIVRVQYLGKDGNPVINISTGYSLLVRSYDENNNVLMESYYDSDGELTNNLMGIASIEWVYDEEKIIKEIKKDEKGNIIY